MSDDEEFEEFNDEEDDYSNITSENLEGRELKGSERKSEPQGTRFEFAKLISERAKQIDKGAITTTKISFYSDITGDLIVLTDSIDIARKELLEGLIPLKVKRIYPNGDYEYWDVNELTFSEI